MTNASLMDIPEKEWRKKFLDWTRRDLREIKKWEREHKKKELLNAQLEASKDVESFFSKYPDAAKLRRKMARLLESGEAQTLLQAYAIAKLVKPKTVAK